MGSEPSAMAAHHHYGGHQSSAMMHANNQAIKQKPSQGHHPAHYGYHGPHGPHGGYAHGHGHALSPHHRAASNEGSKKGGGKHADKATLHVVVTASAATGLEAGRGPREVGRKIQFASSDSPSSQSQQLLLMRVPPTQINSNNNNNKQLQAKAATSTATATSGGPKVASEDKPHHNNDQVLPRITTSSDGPASHHQHLHDLQGIYYTG